MRIKQFMGVVTVVLCFTTAASFAGKNPLSVYSEKWDNNSFNKANTALLNKHLSTLEKEFLQIINLARLSPSLFRQTVLNTYCKNHPYSEAAYIIMSKMISQNNSLMLYPSTPLIHQAKSLIKTNDSINSAAFLSFMPDSLKGTIATLKSSNATEMVLELLTSPDEQGFLFRNYFSGIDNQAGISINAYNHDGYIATILFNEFTLSNSSNKIVNIFNHPNDSILNYFIKKNGNKNFINRLADTNYFHKNAVFMEYKAIKDLKDHLTKNKTSFRADEYTYYVDAVKTMQNRAANLIADNDYNYNTFHFGSRGYELEADAAMDYYYIGRSLELDESSIKVSIIHLTADGPTPSFPKDSIGNFNESITFIKVDSVVNTMTKIEESKLGISLTKPWKTELEKVRAIYYWMRKNIQYDYVGLALNQYTYEVSDVLKKRVGVCEGYANLFDYLCEQAGIMSVKIHGIVPQGEHAWNAVRINKKWYLMDVTWGDNYFLKSPEKFINDHYASVRKWTLLTSPPSLQQWKETYIEKKPKSILEKLNITVE